MESDWEASSDEEEKAAPPAAPAPPKKKGTLKAKLAEKEAQKTARKDAEDEDYDSDEVLDPTEKAKQDRERELKADLHNAAELFGAAALGGKFNRIPRSNHDNH
jgi:translation initiation factor 3 subunit J